MNKTAVVFVFLLAAIAVGLIARFTGKPTTESFVQKTVGMPLNSIGMGPYDNVPVDTAPVDIISGVNDPNELQFLQNNKTSNSCCPSAFTTDMGCVCLSTRDENLMASRGGNRSLN
jgi:hypothetical protein